MCDTLLWIMSSSPSLDNSIDRFRLNGSVNENFCHYFFSVYIFFVRNYCERIINFFSGMKARIWTAIDLYTCCCVYIKWIHLFIILYYYYSCHRPKNRKAIKFKKFRRNISHFQSLLVCGGSCEDTFTLVSRCIYSTVKCT